MLFEKDRILILFFMFFFIAAQAFIFAESVDADLYKKEKMKDIEQQMKSSYNVEILYTDEYAKVLIPYNEVFVSNNGDFKFEE